MRKFFVLAAAVFTLGVFSYAAQSPAQDSPADKQAKAAEFKKQFMEKREQNIAANKVLYEQYKAAKTDKDKKAVEAKIKAQVTAQVDEGLDMTKKGIARADEKLSKAKERQAAIEKNRDDFIAKRVEAVKQGNFGQEQGFGEKCEGDVCALPLTGAGTPPPPPFVRADAAAQKAPAPAAKK